MKKWIKKNGRVIAQVDDKNTKVIYLHHSLSRLEAEASQQSKPMPSTSEKAKQVVDDQSVQELKEQVQQLGEEVQELRKQQEEEHQQFQELCVNLKQIAEGMDGLKTQEEEQSSLLKTILSKLKQNLFTIVSSSLFGYVLITSITSHFQEVQKELTGNQIKADAEFIRASLDSLGIGEKAPEGFLRTLFELIWTLLGQ